MAHRANYRTTRCWMSGAEIALDQACGLERKRALELRQSLAERLGLLELLLTELGADAGNTPRARQLGLPPPATRLISPVVARGYIATLDEPGLFFRLGERRRQHQERWIDHGRADAELGPRLNGLDHSRLLALADVAHRFKRPLEAGQRRLVEQQRIDARLALVYPADRSRFKLEEWLTERDPRLLVLAAGIPPEQRPLALAAVERARRSACHLLHRPLEPDTAGPEVAQPTPEATRTWEERPPRELDEERPDHLAEDGEPEVSGLDVVDEILQGKLNLA